MLKHSHVLMVAFWSYSFVVYGAFSLHGALPDPIGDGSIHRTPGGITYSVIPPHLSLPSGSPYPPLDFERRPAFPVAKGPEEASCSSSAAGAAEPTITVGRRPRSRTVSGPAAAALALRAVGKKDSGAATRASGSFPVLPPYLKPPFAGDSERMPALPYIEEGKEDEEGQGSEGSTPGPQEDSPRSSWRDIVGGLVNKTKAEGLINKINALQRAIADKEVPALLPLPSGEDACNGLEWCKYFSALDRRKVIVRTSSSDAKDLSLPVFYLSMIGDLSFSDENVVKAFLGGLYEFFMDVVLDGINNIVLVLHSTSGTVELPINMADVYRVYNLLCKRAEGYMFSSTASSSIPPEGRQEED